MDEATIKKLRSHYNALKGIQRILEGLTQWVGAETFKHFMTPIVAAKSDFEQLMPPFRPEDYVSTDYGDVYALKAYVVSSLGRLQAEIDDSTGAPVTEKREFLFIGDPSLRKVVERDYDELQRAYVTKCYKSTIILSGGCIEAILLDLLIKNQTAALASPKAPRNPNLTKWDLSDLIKVAVDLKLVGQGIDKLSHSVREYRNLVHPGNELRNKLVFDAEEARIAIEVLNMVHRELS
jgi:hypothetical protein